MPSKLLPGVVSLIGLTLLGVMAVIYELDSDLYQRILIGLGVVPFRFPFVDLSFFGPAADCWRRGIDVYVENPCDVIGRSFNYSPLWLRAPFFPSERLWTVVVGIGIDIAFFLSLSLVLKPLDGREIGIFIFTCSSTMVLFALERANADLLLFIMLAVAGVLASGPIANRVPSYALLLFAGLLKFYPMIGLIIALRERPRIFFTVAAVTGATTLAFTYLYRNEIAKLSQNIPHGAAQSDLFGASNLIVGFAATVKQFVPSFRHFGLFGPARISLVAFLLIAVARQALLLSRNRAFAGAFSQMAPRDQIFLTLGSALIVGCFFAGQSIEYRGVYLIFFVAGLVTLRRALDDVAMRRKMNHLLWIVIFLMWEGLFRHLLEPAGFPAVGGGLLFNLFWLMREILWWYMAAVMLGVLATFIMQSTTFAALFRPRGSATGSATA